MKQCNRSSCIIEAMTVVPNTPELFHIRENLKIRQCVQLSHQTRGYFYFFSTYSFTLNSSYITEHLRGEKLNDKSVAICC